MKLKRSIPRSKPKIASRIDMLINEVKSHPSWKGNCSLQEAAMRLNGSVPFTYLISEGMDRMHFFLSFVDTDGKVKHKNLRIILDQQNWMLKNGQAGSYDTLAPLIPDCLHCSSDVCKPL